MKFMLALLATCYIVLAKPSLPVNPGGIGGLFKGPNSETIIKGPDGSVITSAVQGGEVKTKLEPIVVADISAEPSSLFISSTSASPILIETGPTVTASPAQSVRISSTSVNLPETAPLLFDISPIKTITTKPVEAAIVDAPDVESDQKSDLVGPSGRVSTKGSHAIIDGPASTTITAHAPKGIVAPPVQQQISTVPAAPLVPAIQLPTTRLEGVPAPINNIDVIQETSGLSSFSGTPLSLGNSPGQHLSSLSLDLSLGTLSSNSQPNPIDLPQVSPTSLTLHDYSGAQLPLEPHSSVSLASNSAASSIPTASINSILNGQIISSTERPLIEISTLSPPSVELSPPLVSSTLTPETINLLSSTQSFASSTVLPPLVSTPLPNYLNRDLQPELAAIDHQPTLQLTVNPKLITPQNIVPPEIGLQQRTSGRLLFTPNVGASQPNSYTGVEVSTLAPPSEPNQILTRPQKSIAPEVYSTIDVSTPGVSQEQNHASAQEQNININTNAPALNIQSIQYPQADSRDFISNEVVATRLTPSDPYVAVTPRPSQQIQFPSPQQQYILLQSQDIPLQQPQQGLDTSQLAFLNNQQQNQQLLLQQQQIPQNNQIQNLLTQPGAELGQLLQGPSKVLDQQASYTLNLDYSGGLGRRGRDANNKKKSK